MQHSVSNYWISNAKMLMMLMLTRCSVLGWRRHKSDSNCDYDMHTRMVRNDCLHCNGFRVITTLPPLEKSRPLDSKEAKVRKDIKEFVVRHFDQEFQS